MLQHSNQVAAHWLTVTLGRDLLDRPLSRRSDEGLSASAGTGIPSTPTAEQFLSALSRADP